MGVKGLWTLLEPAARPVRLEALAHRRLAVDASIWLYQLVKAMKDDEGNPVEDAHIIGFYRRICKLLFYGIRPVFVFDGGAPELKRTTIAERQATRGARTNDAKRAAHQLLQTQLKLHAIGGAPTEAQSPTKKRKRDEYELPPIQEHALATRAENARNPRMAHPEDLGQLLALASREAGNVDGVDIDIDSAEFQALPPEDQHDLIVALKVKSRQTSHGRLQQMLSSSDTALDFSKQQIDLLVKRNTLTQQWLQVTGNAHRVSAPGRPTVTMGRIAGERSREYMLSRSDQPGGGWTLKVGAEAPRDESAIMVDSSDVDDAASDEFEDAQSQMALAAAEQLHDTPITDGIRQRNGTATEARYGTYSPASSDDEGDEVASISSGDVDAELMELYGECDALDLVSPQEQQQYQQRLRMQRQREEQAILDLPADEFLDTWAQLVTQSMLDMDPLIYQSMRAWLLEDSPAQLEHSMWRVNRQLEKLPDVPIDESDDSSANDDDSGAATGTGIGGSGLGGDFAALQAKISRLSLLSNYLVFAQRWRVCHSSSQTGTPAAAADTAEALSNVINIESESSAADDDDYDDDDEFEIPDSQPDVGLLANGDVKQPGAVPASVSIELPDEEMENFQKRNLIFARSLELASPENGGSPAVRVPSDAKPVRHLDSGGSDDELSIVDDAMHIDEAGSGAMDTSDAGSARENEGEAESEGEGDDDLDTSDSKHAQLLQDEQDEYARFVGKLKALSAMTHAAPVSYAAMRAELENELQALRLRVRDSKRDASGIEADMVEDIRMLLTLFGIPYVTAPMEAEAQCTVLVSSKLVDGMITDDSDAFLFASSRATRVYRHFFQKDRYVEMYAGEAIFQDSSLSQRDMVFLACLLGSDYTVGIKNIGPVLAMEALAEFGPDTCSDDNTSTDEARVVDALRQFRQWCDCITEVLPGVEVPNELVDTPMRRRLAQVVRKSGVPPSFPDPRVVHAYFSPQVDPSETRFEWGFPQLDMLRQFMAEKLGWSAEKTNETLVPLARKMVDSKDAADGRTQTTLDAFAVPDARLSSVYGAAGIGHSKRVGEAIMSHKRRQTGRLSTVRDSDSL
ncbi:DNA repair protein rad2 [Coemansia sp. Cherry 401B]|nr:DNA repair protein rad2 [Coemansia sp. Cherry 401B]